MRKVSPLDGKRTRNGIMRALFVYLGGRTTGNVTTSYLYTKRGPTTSHAPKQTDFTLLVF